MLKVQINKIKGCMPIINKMELKNIIMHKMSCTLYCIFEVCKNWLCIALGSKYANIYNCWFIIGYHMKTKPFHPIQIMVMSIWWCLTYQKFKTIFLGNMDLVKCCIMWFWYKGKIHWYTNRIKLIAKQLLKEAIPIYSLIFALSPHILP